MKRWFLLGVLLAGFTLSATLTTAGERVAAPGVLVSPWRAPEPSRESPSVFGTVPDPWRGWPQRAARPKDSPWAGVDRNAVVWVPGFWAWTDAGWVWVAGHWAATSRW